MEIEPVGLPEGCNGCYVQFEFAQKIARLRKVKYVAMLHRLAASSEILDAPLGKTIESKRCNQAYGEEIVDIALTKGAEEKAATEIESVNEQISAAKAACEYC